MFISDHIYGKITADLLGSQLFKAILQKLYLLGMEGVIYSQYPVLITQCRQQWPLIN